MGISENTMHNDQNLSYFPKIQIKFFEKDILGFRAIPVLGRFSDITQEQLNCNLQMNKDPLFGFLRVPDQAKTFIVLPSCKLLNNAKQPFAIIIEDYTQIPTLIEALGEIDAASYLKTNKISPTLLIVERDISNKCNSEFYLKLDEKNGYLSIIPATSDFDDTTLKGKILFLCIPPTI